MAGRCLHFTHSLLVRPAAGAVPFLIDGWSHCCLGPSMHWRTWVKLVTHITLNFRYDDSSWFSCFPFSSILFAYALSLSVALSPFSRRPPPSSASHHPSLRHGFPCLVRQPPQCKAFIYRVSEAFRVAAERIWHLGNHRTPASRARLF